MSRYSKEFKLEAIRLINANERPISEIAKELGVKRTLLYRWRDELDTKADGAFNGKPGPKSDNQSELSKLRKEKGTVPKMGTGLIRRRGQSPKKGQISSEIKFSRLPGTLDEV